MPIVYTMIAGAIMAAFMAVAAITVRKALKEMSITVKVYQSDREPPIETKRTKPPTIHLTDKEIKARREALKE